VKKCVTGMGRRFVIASYEEMLAERRNNSGTTFLLKLYSIPSENIVIEQTHPSYPNPTIQEALCEMRFPVGISPFASQFGLIWERLRDQFPGLETFVDVLPPPASNIAISGPIPTQQRFVMRHSTRQFLLQFVPGAFTLNTLAPYLGWETMYEDIQAAWQTAQEVLVPEKVTSLTLRYLNRVPLPQPLSVSHRWLVAGDYVPPAVVNSVPPFQSRVQTGTGTGDVTTVAVAQMGLPVDDNFAMIVDIERTLTGNFSAKTPQIMEQVDALHTDVWDLFKAVKGPQWNDILEGKP
jgi:uncharacterized protein (TIGR04255 family)